jgi:antitoxin component YwqK of YwqJK toxin-antitoxin module
MGLVAMLLLTLFLKTSLFAQDTIFLYGDTIRVGALEWDMQKDWRAKGTRITENRQLYGDHVHILLSYHRNHSVSEINFGYIDKHEGFIKHGPARFYYPGGQLLSKRHFVEGKLQGKAEDYYPNGKVKAITSIVNGQLQGSYTSYFPDGNLEQQCFYTRDSLDGRMLSWYSNGRLKRIEHWVMDAKVGLDSVYYEDGKLESLISYLDNEQDGPMRIFHRNGRQWTAWNFEQGRLLEIEFTQSKEGNPLEVGTFHQGNGWVNLYNDNGLLIERLLYKDGFLKRRKRAKDV